MLGSFFYYFSYVENLIINVLIVLLCLFLQKSTETATEFLTELKLQPKHQANISLSDQFVGMLEDSSSTKLPQAGDTVNPPVNTDEKENMQ